MCPIQTERRRRHYLAEEYDTPLPVKSEYAVPRKAEPMYAIPGPRTQTLGKYDMH